MLCQPAQHDGGRKMSRDEEVIVENTCVESYISVDAERPLMWEEEHADRHSLPAAGGLTALCAVENFTVNQQQYYWARELVISHLWNIIMELP